MTGVVCWALGGLYIVNEGVLSSLSIAIVSGLYFMVSGSVGICGATSYRRSLLVAYVTMCFHTLILFVPCLVAYSVLAMSLNEDGCYVKCDWSTYGCKMLCQGSLEWYCFTVSYVCPRRRATIFNYSFFPLFVLRRNDQQNSNENKTHK
ncbi:unnamed protein product [Soboliphyme baturini]|uniref:G_PROTEIN_RECEP_F1_2 domain-containing protein n=1 Tax=Soboliphyme baturini TaxID=241478 RepID=A0A183J0A6_9BILA|nr:unnamed protein product [Soboliphyme baturini]